MGYSQRLYFSTIVQVRTGNHLQRATTEAENQVEGRLLLDVIVRKSATILKLLTSEDKALLIGGDTLLVLDLLLHLVDGVARLDLEGDSLTSEGLDENLHTSTKAKDEVEGGLLLDVVVGEGAAVLKLLASKDQTLLIGGDTLLVLDLLLHLVDGISGLNLEGDGLAGESLNEDLHTSTEAKNQVEGRLLLNVVIGEGAAILKLLASEDKALLVGGDS
jgi:hypothetical protein